MSAQIGPSYSLAPGATGPIGAQQDPHARLRAAAQQFEAVFLRQMIGTMRQAKLADDWMDSSATDQFQEMADARLADNMSQQGAFGIAQMLIAQFEHSLGGQPQGGTGPQSTAGAAPSGADSNGAHS